MKGLVRYNDIAFTFLREVFKHHSSLWALSATCQQMFQVISGLIVSSNLQRRDIANQDRILDENILT